MKELSFYGLITTPTTWTPDAFYYVENGNNVESYLVGSDGVPRNLGNTQMITSILNLNLNKIVVVANISDRNDLTLVQNAVVLVLDASQDPLVQGGSATYLFEVTTGIWHLIASYDFVSKIVTGLEWDYLTGDLAIVYNSGNRVVANLDGRYRLSTKIEDIVNAGTTVVASVPDIIDGCFIDYSIKERNNKRVGRLIVVLNSQGYTNYTEYSSPEIGLVPASFNVVRVGTNVQVRVTSQVNNLSVTLLMTKI